MLSRFMKKITILLIIISIQKCDLFSQNTDTTFIHQVDSLVKISQELTAKRNYVAALEFNTKVEKIILENLGKESASYGKYCHNYGKILEMSVRDKREAEKWYLEALDVRKRVLGTDHFDYASTLLNLGSLYGQMGNFQKAEPFILEAKEVFKRKVGNENSVYAKCLNNLGIIKMETRNYEKAAEYALEAKDIRLKTIGKNTPEYCGNLFLLGKIYYNMTYYEKAEIVFLEAIDIFTNQLHDQGHPFYVNVLSMLSLLYDKTGEYGKAENIFLENLERLEKTTGKETEQYAGNLNNLANLYMSLGNFEKAEAIFLEALEIKKKVLGRKNQFYTSSLQNLGILYGQMNNYIKAENYFLEAIEIMAEISGKDHPDFAEALANLANTYLSTHQYEKAETNYLLSMEIKKKLSLDEHPDFAILLTNLGRLYQIQKKYEQAEFLQNEAKAIIGKSMGNQTAEYTLCLSNLACLYMEMEDYKKCEPLMKELDSLNQKIIGKAVQHLSANELQKYLNVFVTRQNYLFSLASSIYEKKLVTNEWVSDISKNCFDNNLFYKEFLLEIANQNKRIALYDSVASDKFNLLKSYLRLLAMEYTKPIVDRDSFFILSMEEKSNNLEKEIVRISSTYADVNRQIKWEEVQKSLHKNEAMVDFIHYRQYTKSSDRMVYAALVLKPGMTQPSFVSLCDESELEAIFATKVDSKNEQINSLYSFKNSASSNDSKFSSSLHEIIWKKVDPLLSGVTTVYFSPSGLLHRINMHAIPISKDQVLDDKYQLIEITSSRKLITNNQNTYNSKNALLLGGIQFDADSSIISTESMVVSRSRGEFTFNNIDSSLRMGSWNYLLGTDREVSEIGKILKSSGYQVNLKRGNDASETYFKEICSGLKASPGILHIATHGYFFQDPKKSIQNSLTDDHELVFRISDNPMLRSGLILAGGNASWTGKQTLKGSEDGILTALEIGQLNLSNTELVVLSACETGLGDIQRNEGVYGLQRAFKLAGAKYIIMSLWQVPDKQTSLLMTSFYKKWLRDGKSIPTAFHDAQKDMRNKGLNPYFWAGFVLIE